MIAASIFLENNASIFPVASYIVLMMNSKEEFHFLVYPILSEIRFASEDMNIKTESDSGNNDYSQQDASNNNNYIFHENLRV